MNSEIVFLEKFFPAATEKVRQSSLPTNHCLGIALIVSTPSRRYPYNNSSTLEDITAIFVDSLLRSVHNVGNLLLNWTPTGSACVFQANGTDHAPHLWYHKPVRPIPNLPYLEFRLQGFLQQRYDTTEACLRLILAKSFLKPKNTFSNIITLFITVLACFIDRRRGFVVSSVVLKT